MTSYGSQNRKTCACRAVIIDCYAGYASCSHVTSCPSSLRGGSAAGSGRRQEVVSGGVLDSPVLLLPLGPADSAPLLTSDLLSHSRYEIKEFEFDFLVNTKLFLCFYASLRQAVDLYRCTAPLRLCSWDRLHPL